MNPRNEPPVTPTGDISWPGGPTAALRQAVQGIIFRETGLELAPTAYASLLWEMSQAAIGALAKEEPRWADNLQAVILKGPAGLGFAYPFLPVVEGDPMPPQTMALFGLIYTWLFTFLGKSDQLHEVRFLDEGMASSLDLDFYYTGQEPFLLPDFLNRLRRILVREYHFAPPLRCGHHPAESLNPGAIFSGGGIWGARYLERALGAARERLGKRAVDGQFRRAVEGIARGLKASLPASGQQARAFLRDADRIAGAYRTASAIHEPLVCVERDLPGGSGASPWREANARFFRHLVANDFDRILVEDATRSLGDKKGFQKENRFTISRVRGLEVRGELVPADRMVLKLRGFSHYRGDVNNWLDLIKEFASYEYVWSQAPSAAPYFLETGPLLLTCEKVVPAESDARSWPFDRRETRNWIGFFFEELDPTAEDRIFTCRARFLSDYWTPAKGLELVNRVAVREGESLEWATLTGQLGSLIAWLGWQGVRINYCDLVSYLDDGGQVKKLRIVDLERLSFSELVLEDHLLLDTVVDLKSNLEKDDWYEVLLNYFKSKDSQEGYQSFSEIRSHLRPRSRRRWLILRASRQALNLSRRLGAQALWRSFVEYWVRTRLRGVKVERT